MRRELMVCNQCSSQYTFNSQALWYLTKNINHSSNTLPYDKTIQSASCITVYKKIKIISKNNIAIYKHHKNKVKYPLNELLPSA